MQRAITAAARMTGYIWSNEKGFYQQQPTLGHQDNAKVSGLIVSKQQHTFSLCLLEISTERVGSKSHCCLREGERCVESS